MWHRDRYHLRTPKQPLASTPVTTYISNCSNTSRCARHTVSNVSTPPNTRPQPATRRRQFCWRNRLQTVSQVLQRPGRCYFGRQIALLTAKVVRGTTTRNLPIQPSLQTTRFSLWRGRPGRGQRRAVYRSLFNCPVRLLQTRPLAAAWLNAPATPKVKWNRCKRSIY